MTVSGTTNTAVFETYINQVLVPKLWTGAIVVMDNLSVHKSLNIRSSIESVGVQLVFLPAYSPDLSPIQFCWSKFKEFLRSRKARAQDDLDQAITDAIAEITEDDVFGWFAHCGLLL